MPTCHVRLCTDTNHQPPINSNNPTTTNQQSISNIESPTTNNLQFHVTIKPGHSASHGTNNQQRPHHPPTTTSKPAAPNNQPPTTDTREVARRGERGSWIRRPRPLAWVLCVLSTSAITACLYLAFYLNITEDLLKLQSARGSFNRPRASRRVEPTANQSNSC